MFKFCKYILLLVSVSLLLTGCIGPYAELYKTYKTQKEAQEKQQKEREAREDKILNAPVTTEEHVREKEKILKSRVENFSES